jgi:plasmid stabilization system protein ParE
VKRKLKLIILDEAKEEILDFTKAYRSLAGAASAQKFLRRINTSLGHLRDHPDMGVALEEPELARQGYRKLICGEYLCFYRMVGDAIHVYHVADGRTEYKRLFHSLPRELS